MRKLILAIEVTADRSKDPALNEFSNLVSLWKNNPTCAGGPRAVTKKRQSSQGKLTIAQELTFLGILTTIFKNNNGLQGQTPLQTAQLAEYQQNMQPILGVSPLVRSPMRARVAVFRAHNFHRTSSANTMTILWSTLVF